MDRAELLGLGISDEDLLAAEVKYQKEQASREVLKEDLSHSQSMWAMRFENRKERWLQRAKLFREWADTLGPARLLNFSVIGFMMVLLPIIAVNCAYFTTVGIYDSLVNMDPVANSHYYVEKKLASKQGIVLYVVYVVYENVPWVRDSLVTNPMTVLIRLITPSTWN